MLLYEKDLKSKNPIFPLKEEIIKLLFCSSLGKKKIQRLNTCFQNSPTMDLPKPFGSGKRPS